MNPKVPLFVRLLAFLMLFGCGSWSQAAVVSGSYTGDDTSGRAISVGFQPDMVLVQREDSNIVMQVRMTGMTFGKDLGNWASSISGSDRIQSLTSTGFTLGAVANANGVVYHYLAVSQVAGEIKVGTYSGNGADNRSITGLGFQPAMVMTMRDGATSVWRTQDMPADSSAFWDTQALTADLIQTLEPDGFQVGTDTFVNGSGNTYFYIACKAVAGKFKAGSYSGTGAAQTISGLGFQSEGLFVKRAGTTSGAVRFGSIPPATDISMGVNSTAGPIPGAITSVTSDGFTLGTSSRVNNANAPNTYYYFAFNAAAAVAAPMVTSINPTSGTTAGGTSVTITGTGFTGATGATVGGVALTGFSVVNDTTITGSTGAHAAGVVNVAVTGSPNGASTGGTGIFTYVAVAPEIAVSGNGQNIVDSDGSPSTADGTQFGSVSVSGGSVSHSFTISNTGSGDLNLTGTPNRVAINGPGAAFFSVSPQPSSPVAPSGDTTFTIIYDPSVAGPHTATVVIANDDSNESPFDFTIQGTGIAAPAVTSINPTSGSAAGGTAVTITGTGFTGATGATVGGVALTGFSVVNDTTITGTTGAHAVGAVNVAVTGSPNGASTGGTGIYTYATVTTTTVTSSVNPSAPGQAVTLTATVTSGGNPVTLGVVTFFADGTTTLAANVPLNASGQASTTIAGGFAVVGSPHAIQASYSGATGFATSSGTLSGGQVVIASPDLSIDDVSIDEGDSGTTSFTFTVSLSSPAPAGGVTFDIATADDTATQPGDYTQKSLTGQTIPAGNSTYNFTVLVNGDTDMETNEVFFVNVTNVTGAVVTDSQGQGTIVNDDAASADLVLAITDSPDPVYAGSALAYTLRVTNNGPSTATGVQVTTSLPSTMVLVSTSGAIEDPNGVPVANLGSISPGNYKELTVNVLVEPLASGLITLNASVSSAVSDPVSGNNDASEDTTVLENHIIGDFVWNDLNGDGIQDGGELGLAGVTVFVDLNFNGTLDGGEPNDTTDGAGAYVIPHLSSGNYEVKVEEGTIPAGFVATTANPRAVTLAGGIPNANVDFGLALQETPSLVVTTTSDTANAFDGQTSLREAITYSNGGSAGATPEITFASPLFDTAQTITLDGTQLPTITHDVTITGPAVGVAVSGNNISRVFEISSASVGMNGLTITGGDAGSGGGILVGGGTLTLVRCTVSGNHASDGAGIRNSGTLSLIGCTISGNVSPDNNGGGIQNTNSGTLTASNCTFSGNSAAYGGAIQSTGTVTLSHCTISGNAGQLLGGGVLVDAGVTLLQNTIVAGNSASPGPDVHGGVSGSSSYNLIGDGANMTGISNGTNGNLIGVNPLLGPLASNGGPTQTRALMAGSPAINGGDPAFDPNSFTPPLITDQRGIGYARILGGRVDIGAFEAAVPEIMVDFSGNDVVDGSVTTSTANGTDFGTTPVQGGVVEHTFTITNSGAAVLNVGTVGSSSADFSVTQQPASTVAVSGGTTTFKIAFDPSAAGAISAQISFSTNDDDENPFNFTVTGTGTGPRTFDLAGNAVSNTPFDSGETYIISAGSGLPISPAGGGASGLVSGNAAPDMPGQTFSGFFDYTINASGSVLAHINTAGPAGILADAGVFSDASGTLALLARESDPATPGILTGTFMDFRLSDNGIGFFMCQAAGVGVTSANDYLGVVDDGIAVSAYAREGTEYGTLYRGLAVQKNGEVAAFPATLLVGGAVTTGNDTGIFLVDGNTATSAVLAQEGASLSGQGTTAKLGQMGTRVVVSSNGVAAYYAARTGVPLTAQGAVFKQSLSLGSSPVLVAQKSGSAPGVVGAVFNAFAGESVDPNGNVLLEATMKSDSTLGITSANDEGLWAERNGSLELVIREGDTVGTAELSRVDRHNYLSNGTVVVRGLLKGGTVTATNDGVVFTVSPLGAVNVLLREGDAVPELGNSQIASITRFDVSATGHFMAWFTLVSGTGDATASNNIALVKGQIGTPGYSIVLRKGEQYLYNGQLRTLYGFLATDGVANTAGGTGGHGAAVNDVGAMAVGLYFSDSTQGIFVGP